MTQTIRFSNALARTIKCDALLLASSRIAGIKSFEKVCEATKMSLTSLVRTPSDNLDAFKQAISESLELINYSFPKGSKCVVIKPNMCYYWDYTTGQTTDPKFVGALINLLREKLSSGIDISIVESDASAMKCRHVFRMLGYEKLAKDFGVKLVNLSEDLSDTVKVTVANKVLNIAIPRTIQKADLKINLPKIKYTMDPIKITCALKNIFGCNPYPKKFKYHPRLGEVIVASNKAMKFDLCLIDANIVSGIQPRRLGLVMASIDPVAIDAAAAKIAGISPRSIRYIQLAKKEGLGHLSFVQKGMPLGFFKARYPRRDAKKKLISEAYKLTVLIGIGKRIGLE